MMTPIRRDGIRNTYCTCKVNVAKRRRGLQTVTELLDQRPEELYAATADKAERRRLQASVVVAYRAHVDSVARKLLPPQHLEEATQAGCIGLLLALEKYDRDAAFAGAARPDTGAAFWNYAKRFVLDEIRDWRDRGVYWRPRTRKVRPGADEATAHAQRQVGSLDEQRYDLPEPVIETIACDEATPEDVAGDREASRLLGQFTDTLSDEDREILLSENSQRVRSRRHLDLRERATAFLMKERTRGHQSAVRRSSDSVRP